MTAAGVTTIAGTGIIVPEVDIVLGAFSFGTRPEHGAVLDRAGCRTTSFFARASTPTRAGYGR